MKTRFLSSSNYHIVMDQVWLQYPLMNSIHIHAILQDTPYIINHISALGKTIIVTSLSQGSISSVPRIQTLSSEILAWKMIHFFLNDKKSNIYFKWATRYLNCSFFTSWHSTMGRYNVHYFIQEGIKPWHCIWVMSQVSTHQGVSLTLCIFTDQCLVIWVCYAYGLLEGPVLACFAVLFGQYWYQHWHCNLCHTAAPPYHNSISGVMCCCWCCCWCCYKQEYRNDQYVRADAWCVDNWQWWFFHYFSCTFFCHLSIWHFMNNASTFKLIYSVHHNNYEQEYIDIIHLTAAFLHYETADF